MSIWQLESRAMPCPLLINTISISVLSFSPISQGESLLGFYAEPPTFTNAYK